METEKLCTILMLFYRQNVINYTYQIKYQRIAKSSGTGNKRGRDQSLYLQV